MRFLTYFTLVALLSGFFVSRDLKVFKWKIKDWDKTFYLDRPRDHYLGSRYTSGTAKALGLYFADSSSIHMMVDPPSFDSLNRDFINTKYLLMREYDVMCTDSITNIDTTSSPTPTFSGQLSNGNYWKERWENRLKICYINVKREKLDIYERSISSFRNQK